MRIIFCWGLRLKSILYFELFGNAYEKSVFLVLKKKMFLKPLPVVLVFYVSSQFVQLADIVLFEGALIYILKRTLYVVCTSLRLHS